MVCQTLYGIQDFWTNINMLRSEVFICWRLFSAMIIKTHEGSLQKGIISPCSCIIMCIDHSLISKLFHRLVTLFNLILLFLFMIVNSNFLWSNYVHCLWSFSIMLSGQVISVCLINLYLVQSVAPLKPQDTSQSEKPEGFCSYAVRIAAQIFMKLRKYVSHRMQRPSNFV